MLSKLRHNVPVLRVFRRLGWGAGDQAFSSLTNFALGVAVARVVSPEDFGAFSIAFATFTVSLGLVQAITSDVVTVRLSAGSESEWREGTASATGTAIVIGILTGLACTIFGLVVSGSLGRAVLLLGPAMPGLLLQDTWRYAFFALGKPAWAFTNDLLWAIVLFPLLGALVWTGRGSMAWFMFAWEASALAAAVYGIQQSGIIPRPMRARRWWADQRDFIFPFLGEFAALRASNQIATYAIAAIGGLAAAGAIRGAFILLNPLNVFLMGFRNVVVPEGVRLVRRSSKSLRSRSAMLSSALACIALGWGAVVLLLPDSVGTALLGPTWQAAQPVILPLSITTAGLGLTTGATVAVRSLAAIRRSLRTRLIVAVLKVVASIAGAAVGGAPGAAWGLAVASCGGAAIWWLQLSLALVEHDLETRLSSDGLRRVATVDPP